jgi:hypothetical protein
VRVNTIQQAVAPALLGLAMALPSALHARDPGINQPGALGNPRMDPGINQPGAVGNVGVGAPGVGVGAPGVGVGAPGVGAVDPGLNQPGAVGNTGVARRSVRR